MNSFPKHHYLEISCLPWKEHVDLCGSYNHYTLQPFSNSREVNPICKRFLQQKNRWRHLARCKQSKIHCFRHQSSMSGANKTIWFKGLELEILYNTKWKNYSKDFKRQSEISTICIVNFSSSWFSFPAFSALFVSHVPFFVPISSMSYGSHSIQMKTIMKCSLQNVLTSKLWN